MPTLSGGCLCEAVRFEVEPEFRKLNICHCKQCQRTTGSAFASNLFVDPQAFRWIDGEDRIRRFDVSGRSISNAFCTDCGSRIPYQSKASESVVIPAGTLDDGPKSVPNIANIFWGERAPWYDNAIEATCFDGFADL